MSRLKNQHATLAGRIRASGNVAALRFADEVASLHRGYQAQAETNGRLWHDNRRLRSLLSRAHDALSRPPERAMLDSDWDQLIDDIAKELGHD